jgi:hypothetical protein
MSSLNQVLNCLSLHDGVSVREFLSVRIGAKRDGLRSCQALLYML